MINFASKKALKLKCESRVNNFLWKVQHSLYLLCVQIWERSCFRGSRDFFVIEMPVTPLVGKNKEVVISLQNRHIKNDNSLILVPEHGVFS